MEVSNTVKAMMNRRHSVTLAKWWWTLNSSECPRELREELMRLGGYKQEPIWTLMICIATIVGGRVIVESKK